MNISDLMRGHSLKRIFRLVSLKLGINGNESKRLFTWEKVKDCAGEMCLKMKFYCDDKSDISTGAGMAILNKYNNAKCSFHGKFEGTDVDIAVTLPSCPLNEDSTFEVF